MTSLRLCGIAMRSTRSRRTPSSVSRRTLSATSIASLLPLGGNVDAFGVAAQDKPLANPELAPSADRYAVSPDFMSTMRIRLVRGRAFTDADGRDSTGEQVSIVSAALAARIWPG